MQNILVTGATGFVGSALCQYLLRQGYHITAIVRSRHHSISRAIKQVVVSDLGLKINWVGILQGIDCVIHLAGRAHIVKEVVADPLDAFRHINTRATLHLAQQAIKVGVRRFIFLSSIKVNGEKTPLHQPFSVTDNPAPLDPYGISKYEAELGLQEMVVSTRMELVIIRPPLIYGPHVKANFLTMMKWVQKGIPLPLGAVNNQRSLLALDNLLDFILLCIVNPKAAGQTFLISDGNDLSTTELLQRVAIALRKSIRLVPIPTSALIIAGAALGKRDISRRLCESLQIDMSHTKKRTAWKPPITVDEALQKTANIYLKNYK